MNLGWIIYSARVSLLLRLMGNHVHPNPPCAKASCVGIHFYRLALLVQASNMYSRKIPVYQKRPFNMRHSHERVSTPSCPVSEDRYQWCSSQAPGDCAHQSRHHNPSNCPGCTKVILLELSSSSHGSLRGLRCNFSPRVLDIRVKGDAGESRLQGKNVSYSADWKDLVDSPWPICSSQQG